MISEIETIIEQRSSNRINPKAIFPTLNTNNVTLNPIFIIVSKKFRNRAFLLVMFKSVWVYNEKDFKAERAIMALIFDLAKAVITLFIIVDQLGNIPIFISLTKGMAREDRQKGFCL